MPSDAELLLSYAHHGSEAAFAELVRTHIDLVYSAALRRVGDDSHAAAEVAQDVFVAVARNAERLARHPVLNAWLHTCTRNAAANLLRANHRRERQKLKIQAMQELQPPEELSEPWTAMRDVLDDALDGLSEKDRQAIILRFFEDHSYPEIGRMLALPEETVRMRVERALEKLRVRLHQRGISSTAAAIGGALSSHAVTAAPGGLAASVTAAAATASVSAAGSTVSLIQFMTTTKAYATLAGAAVILSLVAVIHEHANTKKAEAAAATASEQIRALTRERDKLANQAAASVQDNTAKRVTVTLPTLTGSDEKTAALREMFARLPDQRIPELKLATEGDWQSAVDGNLETPEDFRRAMAKVRGFAERRFAQLAQPALRKYLEANGGQFPSEPLQLEPFAGPEIDRAMLQRYRVVPQSDVKNMKMGGELAITQAALIDSEYDSTSVIGTRGFGATTMSPTHLRDLELLKPLVKAYRSAHGDKAGDDIMELMPLATTPEQQAAIQRLARKAAATP